MPEARSISCAAWAPVIPRKVRTLEYFLNADFVLQLAHSDRASAGRMKRKYVGSICMNMGLVFPFRLIKQMKSASYFKSDPFGEAAEMSLAELVNARRPQDLGTGGLGGLGVGLHRHHHALGAGRHLLGAELHGRSRPGGEGAAAHRNPVGHEPELVGLAGG